MLPPRHLPREPRAVGAIPRPHPTEPFIRATGILEQRAGEQRTLVATHLEALVPAEVFRTPEGKSWG